MASEKILELARKLLSSGYYKDGGKIHIKKSHEGRFTAKANAAGKGVQEYARQVLAHKENYPASTVKQANFARNAAKWHGDGGILLRRLAEGGPIWDPSEVLYAPGKAPIQRTVQSVANTQALPINDHYDFAIKDIKRRLMVQENEGKKGWNPIRKRWYPHKSAEGGAKTIAYGIKMIPGAPWANLAIKQGYLTEEQALDALDQMSRSYYDDAAKVYNSKFGKGSWDMLNGKERSFLTDYQYNVKNGGLKKFPKLMEAMHNGDIDGIKRESSRTYTDDNGIKRPLEKRNKAMLEDADSIKVFYPHDYYFKISK